MYAEIPRIVYEAREGRSYASHLPSTPALPTPALPTATDGVLTPHQELSDDHSDDDDDDDTTEGSVAVGMHGGDAEAASAMTASDGADRDSDAGDAPTFADGAEEEIQP